MEYTVEKLARLSGVTARTLRYYDQIGLLKPARVSGGGYRIYGPAQVDRLQQILFYRALGLPLEQIGAALNSPGFDRAAALREHLELLQRQQAQLNRLIENVSRTLRAEQGECVMTDNEKFECFKQKKLEENEKAYGAQLREKYGEETMSASNKAFANLTPEQYRRMTALEQQVKEQLARAAATGDPAGDAAQKLCELHREWLLLSWPKGLYSPQAHLGLAEMYVADPRFSAYYDAVVPGGAAFLRDAVKAFCTE